MVTYPTIESRICQLEHQMLSARRSIEKLVAVPLGKGEVLAGRW